MKICLVILFAVTVAAVAANWPMNYNLYEGYSVLEVIPATKEEVKFLVDIVKTDKFDFWKEPGRVNSSVHIMVHETDLMKLKQSFVAQQLHFTTHIADVSKDINDFIKREKERRPTPDTRAWDINDFNNLEDIEDWLENTLLPACDAVDGMTCSLEASDTQSIEGRDIWIFTMSAGTGSGTILIDGLIHSREWLVGGTLFKIMDRLANNYGTDDEVTELLDAYDFVFIPVLNPDGYEFTWTNERLWRKNRRVNNDSTCLGVDLNRNFEWNWNLQGASDLPCSDLYAGTGGLSEPETTALDNVMADLTDSDSLKAYISYHAYGNMWMHPWGNTEDFTDGTACERADDHEDMLAVANATVQAMMAEGGEFWDYGTSCEVIYATTGASDDHVKGIHGLAFPYNPELRGNSFIISAGQIQPSYEENWAGLMAFVEALQTSEIYY